MSVEFARGSPGKFDSRTLNRETLNRWTGRTRVPAQDRLADFSPRILRCVRVILAQEPC